MENRTDFLKNIGLLFTLTDGFKNLDGLVKGKVKKEVKKGLRELEHTLNNTARTSDGNLKFVSGVDEDPESFIGKGGILMSKLCLSLVFTYGEIKLLMVL